MAFKLDTHDRISMKSSTSVLELSGQKLEFDWIGPRPPHAPTLVWLHDALGCAATWRDLPAELSERTGFGCLNFSRRGHGRSTPITQARGNDYLHHEAWIVLPDVLAACGVRNAFIVGHSDGASIALLYASRRPRGLRGIALEAPHVFVEDRTIEGIQQAVRSLAKSDLEEKLRRFHGSNADGVIRAWHETWLRPEFRGWNIEAQLADIHCPTLVIQGEDDEYGTLNQITAIAEQTAGPVQVVILEDCGHIPHRSHREVVVDTITRFVSEVPSQPAYCIKDAE